MITVAATELKANFKKYAGLASRGNVVFIKRPHKENNLVLVDESQYKQRERILTYFAKLNGYENIDEMCKNENDIIGTEYSIDFMNLFGSIEESDLERPEQGDFNMDCRREML